jgi:hypothetical protein
MNGHRDGQKRGESETSALKNEVYGFGPEIFYCRITGLPDD